MGALGVLCTVEIARAKDMKIDVHVISQRLSHVESLIQ